MLILDIFADILPLDVTKVERKCLCDESDATAEVILD